jgi:hypothetical protein
VTAHRRGPWLVWLQVVLAVLFVYGLVLVVAGSFAQSLFTLLGFGPPASIESTELTAYLRLPFAVLGAVMAGWAAMMLILVRGPLASGVRWALPALAVPLAVWFMLDTGMSLILGYPTHALFNVPFALALGVPLWRLWIIDRSAGSAVTSP